MNNTYSNKEIINNIKVKSFATGKQPSQEDKKYKSIGLHFTKKEYDAINKIAESENRSKLSAIKHAVLSYAYKL